MAAEVFNILARRKLTVIIIYQTPKIAQVWIFFPLTFTDVFSESHIDFFLTQTCITIRVLLLLYSYLKERIRKKNKQLRRSRQRFYYQDAYV